MRIQVKLFATLSTFAPSGKAAVPFDVEIVEGASLGDLVNLLHIPAEEAKITFVNAIAQPPEWVLKENDEVGIFPPIGGG